MSALSDQQTLLNLALENNDYNVLKYISDSPLLFNETSLLQLLHNQELTFRDWIWNHQSLEQSQVVQLIYAKRDIQLAIDMVGRTGNSQLIMNYLIATAPIGRDYDLLVLLSINLHRYPDLLPALDDSLQMTKFALENPLLAVKLIDVALEKMNEKVLLEDSDSSDFPEMIYLLNETRAELEGASD